MHKVNQVHLWEQIPFFAGSEKQYENFCLKKISSSANRKIPVSIRSVQTPDGQCSACIYGETMFWFFFHFKNCTTVDLQRCVNFCCTAK